MVNTAMASVTFWGERSEVRTLPSSPLLQASRPQQTPPHFLEVHSHGALGDTAAWPPSLCPEPLRQRGAVGRWNLRGVVRETTMAAMVMDQGILGPGRTGAEAWETGELGAERLVRYLNWGSRHLGWKGPGPQRHTEAFGPLCRGRGRA